MSNGLYFTSQYTRMVQSTLRSIDNSRDNQTLKNVLMVPGTLLCAAGYLAALTADIVKDTAFTYLNMVLTGLTAAVNLPSAAVACALSGRFDSAAVDYAFLDVFESARTTASYGHGLLRDLNTLAVSVVAVPIITGLKIAKHIINIPTALLHDLKHLRISY